MEDIQSVLPYAVAGVAVAAAAYAFTSSSQPSCHLPEGVSYNNQSFIVPGTEKTERVRRSTLCQSNSNGELVTVPATGERTLYDIFQRGVRVAGDRNCLGHRPSPTSDYVWQSYNQVNNRSRDFGCGLMKEGCKPKSYVGIFCQNRPEWAITEQACNNHNLVLVPLYDTLGKDAVIYIMNQSKLEAVIVEGNKSKDLLEYSKDIKTLKFIVKIGNVTAEDEAAAKARGIKIISFLDLEATGKKHPTSLTLPKSEDVATVCYTSGTTGDPKGALLTHGNIVSLVGAIQMNISLVGGLGVDDVHISYLPLAHMFERVVFTVMYYGGSSIGFFQGDIKLLTDDISTLRPTMFPTVPRLLNRIYDKVVAGVEKAGGVKKMLFDMALRSKKRDLANHVVSNTTIWDKIVFKKIQATLGGRVRICITGAAPISSEVLTFMRCVMGCYILEGYGQTESTAAATITCPGDGMPGHVGAPIPNTEIKLVDVPDMKYFAKDDQGEVCYRGPGIFIGYLDNPEKTKEALDADGWLHSGDIGQWTKQGTLKIVDRKKHIFKLAQGEYIAPEKIENVYTQCPYVAQTFVYGDSLESSLVAVVTPDPDSAADWAKANGKSNDLKALSQDESFKKFILAEMNKTGKNGGLKGFEQARAIYIHDELFSVENGLLTPTFKTKRPEVKKYFEKEIKGMYDSLKSSSE